MSVIEKNMVICQSGFLALKPPAPGPDAATRGLLSILWDHCDAEGRLSGYRDTLAPLFGATKAGRANYRAAMRSLMEYRLINRSSGGRLYLVAAAADLETGTTHPAPLTDQDDNNDTTNTSDTASDADGTTNDTDTAADGINGASEAVSGGVGDVSC
ncbi:hypothetical protein H8R18_00635 [Nanchangia anserum]|uniref:Uncharacterized protein n=1 Tax=Nanchangia anserum TaxID=2692125 RepID=A0A8I0KRU6_9ACTO|nr:hypothetical protein [Nanchangia anserum]MBD3689752.1 hypothetical protein [Nanchangia anserum]QOX81921.1 hypothetical protein H8R18_00635 [Nanchangia anserum]